MQGLRQAPQLLPRTGQDPMRVLSCSQERCQILALRLGQALTLSAQLGQPKPHLPCICSFPPPCAATWDPGAADGKAKERRQRLQAGG